ncbi:MAG: CCDC90 family protein [Zoogloeaceae bacterium]|nr:CCDC90 family protein [Zoogloeaceae bacterium]
MTATTFDTLEFVKTLEAKGFKKDQAEGLSAAMKQTFNSSDIATKNDIEKLELRIRADIAPLKWMTGVTVAGVISLIIKSFF